ncbi:MAG: WYL domain-containing protein [Flavobacteriia bacterium]|nr:WYL domain-containing protein [Flavobacteriia bacterium]
MPHIKNALIRFRIIDRMIRNPYNPFPSKSDLREACEESLFGSSYGEHICDSTIEKDLFAMRMDHDAPIKYSKRNEGYYYENPDFSINDIPLSEDELSAIRFAVQTLQQFQEVPYFKEFGNAIDKIANRVSIVSPDDEDVSKYVGFETILSAGGTHYLPDLLSAIRNKTFVTFKYASFVSGISKPRKVLPIYLKEYRNRWYLISMDVDKNDLITYALDRITDLSFLEEIATEIIAFNAQAFFADTIGITTGKNLPETVRFETNDVAAKYIDSQPIHASQHRIPDSFIFELKVQVNEELIRTFLGYLGEIKVLEPAHLQEKIMNRINKQLEIYQS